MQLEFSILQTSHQDLSGECHPASKPPQLQTEVSQLESLYSTASNSAQHFGAGKHASTALRANKSTYLNSHKFISTSSLSTSEGFTLSPSSPFLSRLNLGAPPLLKMTILHRSNSNNLVLSPMNASLPPQSETAENPCPPTHPICIFSTPYRYHRLDRLPTFQTSPHQSLLPCYYSSMLPTTYMTVANLLVLSRHTCSRSSTISTTLHTYSPHILPYLHFTSGSESSSFFRKYLLVMTTSAPTISALTTAYYDVSKCADPRFGAAQILSPELDYSPDNYELRQFHGAFMLPHQRGQDRILPNSNEGVVIHFYAQGSFIGEYTATVLYIQFVACHKHGSKEGDDWTLFSCSKEHASRNKSLYFIAMEAKIPKFPIATLWVAFTKYLSAGAPAFIHPFPHRMGGDAVMLFSFQFPVGLDPYTVLHLGEKLFTEIPKALDALSPGEESAINTLKSNLFLFITPNLSQMMGGYRLALLSAEDIPPSLLPAINRIPFHLPAWTGARSLEGSIPLKDTTIQIGGLLPSPTSLRDPDYQRSSLATYFILPTEDLFPKAKDCLNIILLETFPALAHSPKWCTHQSFPTPNGLVHLIINPLPPNTPISPARARVFGLKIGLSSPLPCLQIQLRIDIAYYFHFPMETVGNHYHHLPLGPCTSPSTALLSYSLGNPPLEALYLLNVFDCATSASLILPNTTITETIPETVSSSTTQSQPPIGSAPKGDGPILKGRTPTYRDVKTSTISHSSTPPPHSSTQTKHSSPSTNIPQPNPSFHDIDKRFHLIQQQINTLNNNLDSMHRSHDARISALEAEIARLRLVTPSTSAPSTPFSSSFGEIGNPSIRTLLHSPPQPFPAPPLRATPTLASAKKALVKHPTAKLPLAPATTSPMILAWMTAPFRTPNYNHSDVPTPTSGSASTSLRSPFNIELIKSTTQIPTILHPSPYLPAVTLPTIQIQIFVLHMCQLTYYLYPPFHPLDTISAILSSWQQTHFSIPKPFTLTYNSTHIAPNTPLHVFTDTIIDIFINFPIRGGSPSPSPRLPNHQAQQSLYKGPHLRKPLTLQHFNLRIATLNCNGYFKHSPTNRHQLLWDFVSHNKIDVLFLIDHRSSTRTLEHIRIHGTSHLGVDIRLINSDTTLFMKSNQRGASLTNYHASVGGCAILTFGSLAHITFPSTFIDPSGANTFVGAKIIPHSALPPIFLNALYLFPPSTGPTTLHSRILAYLKTQSSTLPPCKWQLSTIESLLTQQRDDHPNCIQIVGGDFNFSRWDLLTHPVSHTFLSNLTLMNSAYEAIKIDPNIQIPVTFPAKNSWIDHFLHSGRTEVIDFKDYRSTLLNCSTDHFPYSNDFTIYLPSQHHHIPRNLHLKAQSRLKVTHLRKNDPNSIQQYQSLCNKHINKFSPPSSSSPTETQEMFYDQTCAFLIKLAKRASKFTIKPSMPKFTTWSPSLAFLYKYIHLLTNLNRSIKTPQEIHSKALKFLWNQYNLHRIIDNTHIFRYRQIISLIYPQFPLDFPSPFSTTTEATDFVTLTKQRCKTLCHHKHQLELRQHISASIARNESLRKEGRLKKVITWILEQDTHPRFSTTVTNTNQITSIPKAAHQATIQHFTNHFTQHPWIAISNINDPSERGSSLRQSLLSGTWRTDFPTLTHTLLPHQQKYAAAYFDNFSYKATTQQRINLQSILDQPIPFEDFLHAIQNRNGIKTPGPTGLSLSILQATPIPILKSLHRVLHTMWSRRHVPKSWKIREMALLPKKPTSIHLNEMRPLMLLEVLRKIWLHLVLKPVATYITQQKLICSYQTGGIANSGTEDAILQVINCLEDSTERAEPLEILAFDKAKAFDSPGRIGGISIAWQRLGLPADVAEFIANCDNDNQIFPRTPYYLCSTAKHSNLSFHAQMGTPQGCSSASLSYLVVEDIILTTFQSHLSEIDPYLARDPHGFLFHQTPTQFVDDTYVFSNSIAGAQNAIQLLQTAEPILNIRINPAKTRHFSLHWASPQNNSKPFYTLIPPTPSLHAFSIDATPIPITPIPLSVPTRVLGAFIPPDLSDTHIPTLRKQISRTASTMLRKKATLDTIWAVLRQSVYPKFTYPLKFTNLSISDLDKLTAPLRHVIRKKANATHIPNAALFSGAATPYSLPFTDLTTFILKEKESTMLRMLGGSHYSRQIIHCLLARGHRLISDNNSISPYPAPCPILPSPACTTSPSHYCWALALIQYLQAANSNINIANPVPTTQSPLSITQTPIHSLLRTALDSPLTIDDIKDFESSYHLYFLEELFPHSNDSPESFLRNFLSLFPSKYHNFLSRIIHTFHNNPAFSLGTFILRDHILIKDNNDSIIYIEGLIPPSTPSHSIQLLTRSWFHQRDRIPTHTPKLITPTRHHFTSPRYRIHYSSLHTLLNWIYRTSQLLRCSSPISENSPPTMLPIL